MESSDLLLCDICMEAFDDDQRQARMLGCHHSFCESCLQCLSAKDGHQSLDCPTCRHITPLTEAGVNGLQPNFYISFMRETLAKLGAPKVKGCTQHSNQPLSFFCTNCSVPICRDCTVIDHKDGDPTGGHRIVNINTAEQQQRQTLVALNKEARVATATARGELSNLEAELGNLSHARDSALEDIVTGFDDYLKMLESRKHALMTQVADMYAEKQGKLNDKREVLSQTLTELSETLSTFDSISGSASLSQVVALCKEMKASTDSVQTAQKQDVGHCQNFIQAQLDVGRGRLTAAVGEVAGVVSDQPLPSRVQLNPINSLDNLVAGLAVAVRGTVLTYSGQKLSDCASVAIAVTDSTGSQIKSHLSSSSGGGDLQVTFTPPTAGECRIQPTFLNHPIKGSALQLSIKHNNPVATYGGKGQGQGKFYCPRAVQVDKDGNLFIADTGNHVIQKLDQSGNFLHQFRIDGGNSEYSTCDLALGKELDIVVCTETAVGVSITPTSGNTIAIYGTNGKLKKRFSNKALKCSLCVAVNSRGDIVVSDYLVHSLFMYDSQGTFLRQVGNPSSFSHPAFICIGRDDNIIVSDTNNDTVQIYDKEGKFVKQFGQAGSGPGQLKQPFGVATDGEHIVVVDSGNHRLQVFTYDGSFVCVIDSTDSPFNQPRGIVLTEDKHVYVADRDNHAIKKYRYK